MISLTPPPVDKINEVIAWYSEHEDDLTNFVTLLARLGQNDLHTEILQDHDNNLALLHNKLEQQTDQIAKRGWSSCVVNLLFSVAMLYLGIKSLQTQ